MLNMLAALASANISAAVPISPSGWVTASDYPYAQTAQEEGVTRFQLTISSEGKIEACQVLVSSGFADLDNLTCELMTTRGRFRPALDQNSTPVWSVFRNQIVWQAPGHTVRADPWNADLILQVNRLPPKVSAPAMLRLHMVAASDGHVEACHANVKKDMADLGQLACQQVVDNWKPRIVTSSDGVAQRSLQSINVQFTASTD